MRKNKSFPLKGNFLLDFLRSAWECGWLDDYSDKHFLIRAIENRLYDFAGKAQLIGNEINQQGIVNPDGSINARAFSYNFCVNFSTHMQALAQTFGIESIKNFMLHQMSAGKQHYNEDSFFQALSEVSILCFYARHNWSQALYEPPIIKGVNNKNPEARFIKELCVKDAGTVQLSKKRTIKVNVEVKTPGFPHDNHVDDKTVIPTVLLTDNGRKLVKEFCADRGLLYMDPRVLKIKDFIISAADKFTIPNPVSASDKM